MSIIISQSSQWHVTNSPKHKYILYMSSKMWQRKASEAFESTELKAALMCEKQTTDMF